MSLVLKLKVVPAVNCPKQKKLIETVTCDICEKAVWSDKEGVTCLLGKGTLLHFLTFPSRPLQLEDSISQTIRECYPWIEILGTLVKTKQKTFEILRRGRTRFSFPLYETCLLRGSLNLLDNFFGVSQGLRRREKVEVFFGRMRKKKALPAWLWEPVQSQILQAYPSLISVEWEPMDKRLYALKRGSKERFLIGVLRNV